MYKFPTIETANLTGKKVLVREDLNVPIENGIVMSDAKIKAAAINLRSILSKDPKQIIILSHLGRPTLGKDKSKFSLFPVLAILSKLLAMPVHFVNNWYEQGISSTAKIVLCENIRFDAREEQNAVDFSKYLASLADVFVMDAFASAHRAHASTVGITKYIPISIAGVLLVQELTALNKIMQNSNSPVVAIVAGSKISSKLQVLEFLLAKVDVLILGGGIANTFLLATGCNIGASLVEAELISVANSLLEKARLLQKQILLPKDAIVATEVSNTVKTRQLNLFTDKIGLSEKILDIGDITVTEYIAAVTTAKTILWNGPVGVFEIDNFAQGTAKLAQAIADSTAYSVAGGGDTIAAIEKFKLIDKISYISTGGGAFLEMLEGKILPAVKALMPVT